MADDEEDPEVAELREMFGSPPRESSVPLGMFVKFMVSQENRQQADIAREEKQERQRLLQERARQQYEKSQELKRQRGERDQEAVERLRQRNLQAAQELRQREAEWQAEREAHLRDHLEVAKKRVQEGGMRLDARLDAAEEEQDQKEREEATRERERLLAEYNDTRQQRMQDKRKTALKIKSETSMGVGLAKQQRLKKAQDDTNDVKNQQKNWRLELEANEAKRLQRANANRAAAVASRKNGKANREKKLAEKKEAARRERANDHEARDEKARILEANRAERAERYRNRFVNAEAAATLENSTFRRLYSLSTDAPPAEEE